MKIRTSTQMEKILRTAFDVEGNSIKTVAAMAYQPKYPVQMELRRDALFA